MPNKVPSSHSTKLLYLGDTGTGKTGSLMSLAAAGYNVRILNLDAAPEIIFGDSGYLYHPKSMYRRAYEGLWTLEQARTIESRMSYITINEGYRITGLKAMPKGDSWHKIQLQLNNWTDGDVKFGNIGTWTSKDVLVIDGLSRLFDSAMYFTLAMRGQLSDGMPGRPRIGNIETNDYTPAYGLMTDFMDLLKSDEIKCNIILICHITYLDTGPKTNNTSDRPLKGYPQSGRKISPMIGQYFAHALRARSSGTGPSIKRVIVTHTDEMVDLKNSAPLKVKSEYDLSTGLAEYFRDIRAPINTSPPDSGSSPTLPNRA